MSWKEVNRGRSWFFLICSVFYWDNTCGFMWILFRFYKYCFTLYGSALQEAIKVAAATPTPSQQLASSASVKKSEIKYSLLFCLLCLSYCFLVISFWSSYILRIHTVENSCLFFRRSRQPFLVINLILDFYSKISQFNFDCQKRIFNYI